MNTKVKRVQHETHTQSTHILGVRFDTPNRELLQRWVRSDEAHRMYTPNAEMLVCASRDTHFKEVLNRSSMNICDGSGPAYMARIFEKKKITRMCGTDFLFEVLTVAATEGKLVFLLGSGDPEVLAACKRKFTSEIDGLRMVGTHPGIKLDLAKTNGIHTLVYDEIEMALLHDQIIMAAPDVLIVAFGHPKQELFIDTFLDEFPSVRIAMGVGGALDFYAGKVRRAPKVFRTMGLESIWRLVLQPWRWKRVFTALVIFPILFIQSKVKSHVRLSIYE